jgi:hypothetical protein
MIIPANDVAFVQQQATTPVVQAVKIIKLYAPYLSAKIPGMTRPKKLAALIIESI